MTALPSGPPHAERAWDRWQRVVEAVGAKVVGEPGEGRAEMACPVHGGEKASKFAISVGDESDYPVLWCRTGCKSDDRETWLPLATAALLALGAPADALPPAKGQRGRRQSSAAAAAPKTVGRSARAARLPTEDQLDRWESAFLSNDLMRRALMRKWRLSEDVVAAAEVGYDQAQERVVLPVRDGAGEVVQVIYRSLRDDLPPNEPKTKTHKGVSGSFVYAPFGVEDGDVLLCAGERDTFAAHAQGLNAVCFTNGERSVPSTERLNLLRGRDVVVAYDNDDAGRQGAQKAAAAVAAVAKSVRMADLSTVAGLPVKGDVADVLAIDDGEQLLRAVLASAEAWEGQPVEVSADEDDEWETVLAAVRAEFLADLDSARNHTPDLLDDDGIRALPPVEYVVDGWVPRGGYTVLYGEPGVGKTFALMGMARAVRRGTRWQDNATQQGAVLFYQGEGLAQFRERIDAWEARYPLRSDQRMAPWGTTERIVDLTAPEGVAAVVCTVRGFERQHGEPVRLLVIDPLVEYMTGEENGEGMQLVTRGLRALAKLLDAGVVVGHHSNASGERERGALHLRMRAGAFLRMEKMDEAGTSIGVMQQKQRNAAKQALVLEMRSSERSVVLEWTEALLAQDYVAKRAGEAKRKKTATKVAEDNASRTAAEGQVLAVLRAAHAQGNAPMPQGSVYAKVGGNREKFKALLLDMEEAGLLSIEVQGTGRPNLLNLTGAGLE